MSQPRAELPQPSDESSKLGLHSLSQNLTPSGRTSRLRPAISVQTRRIIPDWTISDSQTGHLRTDWRATVPAQTSTFRLDIYVQAKSLQMRRHRTNHLRQHSLRPDFQTQTRHPSAALEVVGLGIQVQRPRLQTGHSNSAKVLQIRLRAHATQQISDNHNLRPQI